MNNPFVLIRSDLDRDEKRQAIEACDASLPRPVTPRDNYDEIFEKMDRYAEFIAAYQNGIAGYVSMYANDQETKTAFITLFVVKDEFQRMHIGTELMNACRRIAERNKMKRIRLEVLNSNMKAISFYKKQGFYEEKPCSNISIYMLMPL